jgi:hypothetical protein
MRRLEAGSAEKGRIAALYTSATNGPWPEAVKEHAYDSSVTMISKRRSTHCYTVPACEWYLIPPVGCNTANQLYRIFLDSLWYIFI